MMRAVIYNKTHGIGLLKLVLNYRPPDIEVMEQVAKYADQRSAPWGKEAFQMFLEHQTAQNRTITTQEFAIIVRWCSTTSVKRFLQFRRSKAIITSEVARAVIQNKSSVDFIIQQLLREREYGVKIEHNAAIELIRKLGTPVLNWLLLYRPEQFTDRMLIMSEVLGQFMPAEDRFIRNPLPFAAERGYKGVVQLLLERGAFIEETSNADGTGPTALVLAVASGHRDIASFLIQRGANIEAVDENGRTPLLLAAEDYEGLGLSELLLYDGSNVNAADNHGRTPLMAASRSGSLAVVKMILSRGARIDSMDKEGRTALMDAAFRGHSDVVQQLLERGANEAIVDRYGETALTIATKEGHVKVVKEFEDHQKKNGRFGGRYGLRKLHSLKGLGDT